MRFALVPLGLVFGLSPYCAMAQVCDPNYALKCVPVASDVDCAGGRGDGPAYVEGPVKVIGRDIYELDRDGDKIGCEPKKKKKTRGLIS